MSESRWRIDPNIVLQTLALILVVGGYIVRAEARMARFEEQLVMAAAKVQEIKVVCEKLTDNQRLVTENQTKVLTIIEEIQKRHDRENGVRK